MAAGIVLAPSVGFQRRTKTFGEPSAEGSNPCDRRRIPRTNRHGDYHPMDVARSLPFHGRHYGAIGDVRVTHTVTPTRTKPPGLRGRGCLPWIGWPDLLHGVAKGSGPSLQIQRTVAAKCVGLGGERDPAVVGTLVAASAGNQFGRRWRAPNATVHVHSRRRRSAQTSTAGGGATTCSRISGKDGDGVPERPASAVFTSNLDPA